MDIIVADTAGYELGVLSIPKSFDVDIGETDDFQLSVSLSEYMATGYGLNVRVYVPGSEYGGITTNMMVTEAEDSLILSGDTWRGMLGKKVIEPDSGEDYKIVSGDANAIIRTFMTSMFGADLFVVPSTSSGFTLKNFKFDRYCTLYAGLKKMLTSVGAKLKITYDQGSAGGAGHVQIEAVAAVDYSNTYDYASDSNITFTAESVKNGVNHLICLGQGKLKDRQVVHLYVQKNGSIGKTKYYTGADERVEIYDYGNVETLEDLEAAGIAQLNSLRNYENFDIDLGEIDAEIGDTVTCREYITGLVITKEIAQKILRLENEDYSIEYSTADNSITNLIGGGAMTSEQMETIDETASLADSLSSKKIGVLNISTCATAFDLVDKVTQEAGFMASGRLRDTGAWTPIKSGWGRYFAIFQNAYGGSYSVDGQVMLMKGSDCYHGFITGGTSSDPTLTVTWTKLTATAV